MLKRKAFVGFKPYLLTVDNLEGLDIDEQIDFEIAEFLYKKWRLNND